MEEITQIKVVESELKTFCHWIRSHCKIEIRPTVTGQINQTSVVLAIESELQFFITAKRKDLKNNKTYAGSPLPLPMFRWKYCTGDHGDPYLITAIGKHINAGTEKSLTINFTPTVKFSFLGGEATLQTLGLSRTVKHTVKDTPLGTFAVNYCDTDLGGPWSSVGGHGYTTGTFTAWIRERH